MNSPKIVVRILMLAAMPLMTPPAWAQAAGDGAPDASAPQTMEIAGIAAVPGDLLIAQATPPPPQAGPQPKLGPAAPDRGPEGRGPKGRGPMRPMHAGGPPPRGLSIWPST